VEKECSVQMMMKMMSEGPLHKAPYFSGSMLRILLLAKIHAYWMIQMMTCRRHLSLYLSQKSAASDNCQFHRHICRLTVDSLFGYSLLTAILFAIYL